MKIKELAVNGLFSDGDWIESKDQDPEGDIRLIQLADIGDGYFVNKSNRFMNKKTAEKLKCTFLNKDDVLIARMPDPIGRACLFPFNESGKYVTVVDVGILRITDKYDSNYVMYGINSPLIRRQIEGQVTGTTRLRITKKKLGELEIPLPPLVQQKKIAAVLDAADAYRQKTKALIEKYDELTQSLFLDMFGDPVTNPKLWEKIEFSNVAINMNSKRIPIKQADREQMQGDYPYYGATGIVDYINDFKFDGEFLLIAEDGKNLVNRKKPIAWTVNGQFWVNNHSHVVKYNGVSNLTFLAFQLNRTNISQYVTGIDQFKMNKSNLNRIPISTPPLTLQNQFAERVQAIEAQKAQAQASLAQADHLFSSLLQRAFKGELV